MSQVLPILQKMNVDVSKRNVSQTNIAKQGDILSRNLHITLCNNGKPIVVEQNNTVLLNILREDGQSRAYFGTINEDGTLDVTIPAWALEITGIIKCSVSIIDADERKLTSSSFTKYVEELEYDGSEVSEDDNYDILVDLIAQVTAINGVAEQAKTDAQDSASISRKYADGKDLTGTVDPIYTENNSKYHSEQAAIKSGEASGYADIAQEQAEYAQDYAQDAGNSANAALGFKNEANEYKGSAITNAILSRKFADGKDLTGVVDPEFAENNSKYYADEAKAAQAAAEAARDGVNKVNISATQDNLGASITVTDKDGIDTTVHVYSLTEVNSWNDIRNAVRLGLAPTLFPIGYEFKTAKTNFGDIVWRVVAHNHHKAKNPYLTKTMTIEKKFVFGTTSAYKAIQFDAPKALYFAEAGLVAGTYNFTLLAGYDVAYGGGKTFEFTLTQDVPVGGQLTFPWGYNLQASATKVYSWASSTDTIGIENVPVIEGNGGTALGETNGTGNINHIQRVRYGSNNYAQSAIRQLFNSSAALGGVWAPQTKFDRPPTWHTSTDPAYVGFMNGLAPEFLEVVETAVIPCRTNSICETNSLDGTTFTINQTYNLTDKFFLLSRPEMYGDWDSALYKDGELLDFYNGLTNTEKIKYDGFSVARNAWLRSPNPGIAYGERGVSTDGSLSSTIAYYGYGASAACIIA